MDRSEAYGVLGDAAPAFPHCDTNVLHAPGECYYCDKYPQWQALRVIWGIAFTGHRPVADTGVNFPCPSDYARGLGGAHVWPGNQAQAVPLDYGKEFRADLYSKGNEDV